MEQILEALTADNFAALLEKFIARECPKFLKMGVGGEFTLEQSEAHSNYVRFYESRIESYLRRHGLSSESFLAALLAARAPESLFNLLFLGLSGACAALVVGTRSQQQSGDSDTPAEKPEMVKAVSALKWRFLAVFWLYKMADWLQGPYFYDVYASKIINGVQVNSEGVARLFLMGFGSTAVFGAAIGGLVAFLVGILFVNVGRVADGGRCFECATSGRTFCDWSSCNVGCDAGSARHCSGVICTVSSEVVPSPASHVTVSVTRPCAWWTTTAGTMSVTAPAAFRKVHQHWREPSSFSRTPIIARCS